MASDPTVPIKPAFVSFKLLNLKFVVLHNFLDIMPLADLYVLRECNDTIKSLSCFRGKIVQALNVEIDAVGVLEMDSDKLNSKLFEKYDDTSYTRLMNRPYKTTPFEGLDVHMGPDIIPEALLSKMDEKCYTELCLNGEYHWKDVMPFLHKGLKGLYLHDILDLPQADMKEFFRILLTFRIPDISFVHDDCDDAWAEAALEAWSLVVGSDLGPLVPKYGSKAVKIPIGDTDIEVFIGVTSIEDELNNDDDDFWIE